MSGRLAAARRRLQTLSGVDEGLRALSGDFEGRGALSDDAQTEEQLRRPQIAAIFCDLPREWRSNGSEIQALRDESLRSGKGPLRSAQLPRDRIPKVFGKIPVPCLVAFSKMDRRCGSVEQPSKKKRPTEITDLGELLPVILSLLPTKESVRTSILSKQWQTIWTAVTVLDFDDQIRGYRLTTKDKSNMKKFSDFVDRVIHSIKYNIKRFRLQGHSYPTVKILDWLESAIVREVEEVELSFLVHTKAVPWDLMSCKTLTVLKLNGVDLSPVGSNSVDLPNLEVLHLGENAIFTSHFYVVKLLRGCPLLKELVLESLRNCCTSDENCTFEEIEVTLKDLVKAKLNFWWEKTCPMAKIFSAFCDVESLSISSSLSQCLVYDSLESFPMRFPKLVKLKLSFHDYLWNLLVELLLRSPDLEILRISKEPSKLTVNEVMGEETRWKQPPKLPLHLKTLSIRNYEGHEAELDFVQYVMENADTLEKVAISFARSLPRKVENQIRESLRTFTKSEKCQVECENQYACPPCEKENWRKMLI